jgi:hypothetical protein
MDASPWVKLIHRSERWFADIYPASLSPNQSGQIRDSQQINNFLRDLEIDLTNFVGLCARVCGCLARNLAA